MVYIAIWIAIDSTTDLRIETGSEILSAFFFQLASGTCNRLHLQWNFNASFRDQRLFSFWRKEFFQFSIDVLNACQVCVHVCESGWECVCVDHLPFIEWNLNPRMFVSLSHISWFFCINYIFIIKQMSAHAMDFMRLYCSMELDALFFTVSVCVDDSKHLLQTRTPNTTMPLSCW